MGSETLQCVQGGREFANAGNSLTRQSVYRTPSLLANAHLNSAKRESPLVIDLSCQFVVGQRLGARDGNPRQPAKRPAMSTTYLLKIAVASSGLEPPSDAALSAKLRAQYLTFTRALKDRSLARFHIQ